MKHNFSFKLLISGALLLATVSANAQNVKTEIKSVTVYRNGAMVSRNGVLNVPKGNTTLYLNNLSTELDPNTLRVGIENHSVKILSVKHEIDVVDNEKAQKQDVARDKRMDVLRDSLSYYNAQLSILASEEGLISSNKNIGGQQNGVSAAELKAMTDFYKKELNEIATKKIAVNKRIKRCKDELNKLTQEKQNSQKELQKKDSRVKLVLSADAAAQNVPVTLSYLIFSAKWEPYYEVRAEAVNKPLDLVYGAHISQSSTEDWNGVKLTVSTGDPSVDNAAPDFAPMYLPPVRRTSTVKKWTPPVSRTVYGIVTDEKYEPIPGANVIESGTVNGTITDQDGKFNLEMKDINNKLEFSYIGYVTEKVKPSENMQISLTPDVTGLDEVVVVGYGVQNKEVAAPSPYAPVMVRGANSAPEKLKYSEPVKNVPLQLAQSQTTTEFKIDVPYTVPSDGKQYDVSMLTYHIDAGYRFTCLPRSSKDVFLMADLKDFSQYPLLKGNAYIYLDNAYQGECEIAPDFAADTFAITIGRDKDIAVNRQAVKEFTSKKIIGTTVKVVKCYEITVKNNKNEAVSVELTDQYPLPKFSDIKVDLTDKGGAEVNAETGKLTWKLNLAPQEKKVLRFSYEVKYPKTYNFSVE
ncbi:MAG: mucoidy inhibitor MuiA family protein [Salinivirgaceae bacterium]|nr:mucoidy inhibitor MuiA family protein [Salinivirgaceae bacterium]